MCNENVVHKETYKGYTIKILPDEDGMNPIKEFDMAGKMVCWHRRYNLGHEQPRLDPQAWLQSLAEQAGKNYFDDMPESLIWKVINRHYIFLPLNLYDHSGISISTISFVGRAQHAEWDSGQVGWIYISKADAIKEFGKTRYNKTVEQKAINCLVAEVKTYDDYLTGNVYGYIVEDAEGNNIESCWGFYPDSDDKIGYEYCLSEAKSQADYLVEQAQKKQVVLDFTNAYGAGEQND